MTGSHTLEKEMQVYLFALFFFVLFGGPLAQTNQPQHPPPCGLLFVSAKDTPMLSPPPENVGVAPASAAGFFRLINW